MRELNQLKTTLESSTIILNLDEEEIMVEEENTHYQDVTMLDEVDEEVALSHVMVCHDGIEKDEDQQTKNVNVYICMGFVTSCNTQMTSMKNLSSRGSVHRRRWKHYFVYHDGCMKFKKTNAVLNNSNLEASTIVVKKKKPSSHVLKSNQRVNLK